MITNRVAFINKSTVVKDDVTKSVMEAMQIQVSRDFAPVWGIDTALTFYSKNDIIQGPIWQLVILDNTDQAGYLGYHDSTENEGLPLGKIFAQADFSAGTQWSVTASHELLEMLADPDLNQLATKQQDDGSNLYYQKEVCDMCNADEYGYTINGILVSDFVFPSWFEQFHPQGTQYDYNQKVTKMSAPFQVLKNCQISVNDGTGWTQQYGPNSILQYNMRAHVGSRRERRRIPRNQWIKSVSKSYKN